MTDLGREPVFYRDLSPSTKPARLDMAPLAAAALILVLMLVAMWLGSVREPVTMFPIVAGLTVGAVVWATVLPRRCIRLDRRGLTEIGGHWRAQHFPWQSVESTETDGESAVIHTTLGDIDIGPSVQGGRALAALVKLVLEQRERARTAAVVERAQVAEWLGVAPGEGLCAEVRDDSTRRTRTMGCLAALMLGLCLWSMAVRHHGPVGTVLGPIGGVCAVIAWSLARKCPRRVEATADGLRVECLLGRRHLAWSDLLTIAKDPQRGRPGWVVRTLRGRFTLHTEMPGAARLARAIKQAIAARRKGALLPRMSDVSDAAISPVSASISAERGVSRAEGDPEP